MRLQPQLEGSTARSAPSPAKTSLAHTTVFTSSAKCIVTGKNQPCTYHCLYQQREVHRHRQKPALHIPLSLPAARSAPSPAKTSLAHTTVFTSSAKCIVTGKNQPCTYHCLYQQREVHRHRQKPALHIPLSLPAALSASSPAKTSLAHTTVCTSSAKCIVTGKNQPCTYHCLYQQREVHRHRQKPALHIPLSLPAARSASSPAKTSLAHTTVVTSSAKCIVTGKNQPCTYHCLYQQR